MCSLSLFCQAVHRLNHAACVGAGVGILAFSDIFAVVSQLYVKTRIILPYLAALISEEKDQVRRVLTLPPSMTRSSERNMRQSWYSENSGRLF